MINTVNVAQFHPILIGFKQTELQLSSQTTATSRQQTQASACFYLVVVALKELQEAGLGPRGPLDPAEAQVVPSPLQVADVHGQVLQPQTRSFPHRGQLGRPGGARRSVTNARSSSLKPAWGGGGGGSHSLVVREAKRREVGVLLGKVCQPVDDSGQLWEAGQQQEITVFITASLPSFVVHASLCGNSAEHRFLLDRRLESQQLRLTGTEQSRRRMTVRLRGDS